MMPCGSGWGFHPKQGLVTLPRFPQPLSAPAGSRVTRPLLRGKMVFNWYTCCASFGARWYRIDILAVNILWLYYVDISLSYFQIEFALWANYLSAIWLFVFCSQIVKWYIHGKTLRDIVVTESQWVKYYIISNMLWPGFSSLLSVAIFQLFMGECFVAMKRRLCVDFETNHKRAQHDILSAHSGLSRGQCMMKCAADARCTAFNFRSGDGFCEHMPKLPKCYEPDDNEDFTFTQLKPPDFKPLVAKQAKPLGTSDMEWLPCDSTTVPTSSNVRVTSDIYVALCFNRGMYLPAYWKSSLKLIRVFDPLGDKNVLCDHGYVISARNPEQYKWASFHTESPIPVGSVSAGSHVDATPLYILDTSVRGKLLSGGQSGVRIRYSLTQWGRERMASISQTFSNWSSMTIIVFWS